MNSILEFLKVNAKAVAGVVVGLVLTAIQKVLSGEVAMPHTLNDWYQYLGAAVLSGLVVWATGNKLTEKQIVTGAVQQGISVVTGAAVDTVSEVAHGAVAQATKSLPQPARDQINTVAQEVSDAVSGALKTVSSNFPDVGFIASKLR